MSISIHAPREGGDESGVHIGESSTWYFNPRPPRGGRRFDGWSYTLTFDISIHAPREGGDHRDYV